MSLELLVESETLKIELQELFSHRRQLKDDLRVSVGRGSSQTRICVRATEQMIAETKERIDRLEQEIKGN